MTAGLWRKQGMRGKYDVHRVLDGSTPPWPWFVLGARDPAAPHALRAYASKCMDLGMDDQYVRDILDLAEQFESFAEQQGYGKPDEGPPEDKVPYETKCLCGDVKVLQVFKTSLEAWENGVLVQDAFPYLDEDDRERLISGTCEACWTKLAMDDGGTDTPEEGVTF